MKHSKQTVSCDDKKSDESWIPASFPRLIPFRLGEKWGYSAPDKTIVINCDFDGAYPFAHGIAQVNRKLMVSEAKGKTPAVIKTNWNFIDENGLELLAEPVLATMPATDGLAFFRRFDKTCGFVNAKGEIVADGFADGNPFSEGLAAMLRQDGQRCYIDMAGKEVFIAPYDQTNSFCEGFARVIKNGQVGFIDTTGKEVIPCQYKSASSFSEGLSAIKTANYTYGYIDACGNIAIPFEYDDATPFSEGLAAVKKKEGKYGYIDRQGNVVIPFQYGKANSFSHGLAFVAEDIFSSGFCIDRQGVRKTREWRYCSKFSDGLAYVTTNINRGFINVNDELVIPEKYDSTGEFEHGLCFVSYLEKKITYRGYIDTHGTEFWENIASAPVKTKISTPEKPADIRCDNYKQYTKDIDTEKADEEYGISNYVNYPFLDFANEQDTCIHKGNLHLKSLTVTGQNWSPFNLIVDGNLTVDEDIEWNEWESGSFLFVTGNLTVRNLFLSGCVEAVVLGNLTACNGMVGSRGDDGGVLTVKGSTKAKLILNTLYFNMWFANRPEAIIIDDSNMNCSADFDGEEVLEVLLPKFIEEDGESMDEEAIMEAMQKDEPVLRKGAVSAREALLKRLDEIANNAEKITTLDLSDRKLEAIPEQVFRLHNLVKLYLNNNPLKTLPADIGKLKKLEVLTMRYCQLESLPPEIGELGSLRVLDVRWGNNLNSLPEEIGKLKNLETLKISDLNFALPKTFTSDVLLKELYVDNIDKEGTESIFKLKSLIKLDTCGISWNNIGERFLNFPLLEELKINLYGATDDLSALPKLKHLKVLKLDGYKEPRIDFLLKPEIWDIPTLEELELSRWGKTTQYNPKLKKHETVRPELTRLPEYAFDNLVNLRKLTIGSAAIETLPESFFKLKNLQEVNMEYACLDANTVKRICETFPTGVKFDIRRSEREAEKSSMPVHIKVSEGAGHMSSSRYSEAVTAFENAIIACGEGNGYSDADYLYAHYGIIYSSGRIIPTLTGQKEREEAIDRLIGHSRRTLDLVPQPENIWIFTSEGAFQREVNRTAGNALGWYLYVKGELDEAMDAIERAGLCIDDHSHFFIYDTKVRILLAMGRTDEAYRIVDLVLSHDPDFTDFSDLKLNEDFLRWKTEN